MIGLQADLQQSLVTSLQLGLTNLGVDPVFSLCCDFIQVIKYCFPKLDTITEKDLKDFILIALDFKEILENIV